MFAAYATHDGLACVRLPVSNEPPEYPDLSIEYPSCCAHAASACSICSAYARATRTISAPGYVTPRGQLTSFRYDATATARAPSSAQQEQYPFVTVAGDGVHEIPVGPIHAGIIEPGHFRFSIVGEKVLRLEERLGYVHKGIDKLFDGMPLSEGHRLAGRVSGDSTVAYAWAYAMAVESVTRCVVPPRSDWLRALLLERERVANHLGDLGALGNDAGLAFGLAQFSRLREQWLTHQQSSLRSSPADGLHRPWRRRHRRRLAARRR